MLRHQIRSGALKPGAPLPALSELTAKLGVARMTIRQAMDALDEEGLIERQAGRGTFVKQVDLHQPQRLKMSADMGQLDAMVAQLEVAVLDGDVFEEHDDELNISFRRMKRIHALDGKPFCRVDLRLDSKTYELAKDRFASEIVVRVLHDVGIDVASAHQRVKISYADYETAQELEIKVNSAVFHVDREFFDNRNNLIYSATLIYPGDMLEFDIEFTVDSSTTP